MTLASAVLQRQCPLLVQPKASRPVDGGDVNRIAPLAYRLVGDTLKSAGDFQIPALDVAEEDWVCCRGED